MVAVALVVSVSVSGIRNTFCEKNTVDYCCPSIMINENKHVAATEKKAAARSNPFVKIFCDDKDFINQGRFNRYIITYTRFFGIRHLSSFCNNGASC